MKGKMEGKAEEPVWRTGNSPIIENEESEGRKRDGGKKNVIEKTEETS